MSHLEFAISCLLGLFAALFQHSTHITNGQNPIDFDHCFCRQIWRNPISLSIKRYCADHVTGISVATEIFIPIVNECTASISVCIMRQHGAPNMREAESHINMHKSSLLVHNYCCTFMIGIHTNLSTFLSFLHIPFWKVVEK